jgi:hypothetical protein
MNDIEEIPQVYRHRMVRPVGMIDRQIRKNGETLCLATYIKINGKELVKPVTLQLGCSGSRSKINFATESLIEFASIDEITYLDIVNLDKYDTILGTLFMRKHGISLDFERQEIVIHGKLCIPALPEGEGEVVAKPKTVIR